MVQDGLNMCVIVEISIFDYLCVYSNCSDAVNQWFMVCKFLLEAVPECCNVFSSTTLTILNWHCVQHPATNCAHPMTAGIINFTSFLYIKMCKTSGKKKTRNKHLSIEVGGGVQKYLLATLLLEGMPHVWNRKAQVKLHLFQPSFGNMFHKSSLRRTSCEAVAN